MKSKYVKKYHRLSKHPGDFAYVLQRRGYHRRIRTFPELRRNAGDLKEHGQGVGVRLCRNRSNLDAWNDYTTRSRNWKRSWKDFTKHRKQWMVGSDPDPIGYAALPPKWWD